MKVQRKCGHDDMALGMKSGWMGVREELTLSSLELLHMKPGGVHPGHLPPSPGFRHRVLISGTIFLCVSLLITAYFKRRQKKRFIGRTLAPLHYDYTTTIVPALKLALFGFSSSPPFVSPGSSLSLLFSNSKSGNPGENILHPLLKWAPWR